MKLFQKQLKKIPLLALIFVLALPFGFSKSAHAQSSGDLPVGGFVSILGPALAVTIDKEICQAMNFTVVEVTVTTTWNADTDQGEDQTFTLIPNYSPSPHPNTYRLERSVQSKTPDSIGEGKWLLGMYQDEYKKIATCTVRTTTAYPPSSESVDIPFYLQMGKITMYGVSGSSV